jgi:hypothetical protein
MAVVGANMTYVFGEDGRLARARAGFPPMTHQIFGQNKLL